MTARTRQDTDKALQWAIALHQGGRLAEATSAYEEIVRSQPSHAHATFLLGLSYAQQGKLEPAAKLFGKAAKLNPGFVDAHFNCGMALQALGDLQKALQYYNHTIRLKADHADALYNRGVLLNIAGRHQEAVQSLDQALAVRPNHAQAHSARAMALSALERFEEALQSCDRALAIEPNYAEACSNRAAALRGLKRFEEALQSADRAIRLRPDYAEAHANRGAALGALKRFEEALQSSDRAIELKRDLAEAHCVRVMALNQLNRFDEALQSSERALELNRNSAEACFFRGIALRELNRFEEAAASYARAIKIKPDYAEAYVNRGVALGKLRRFEEALQNYKRAFELQPDGEFSRGNYLHARMQSCDWSDYPSNVADLHERLARAEKVAPPFFLLALPGSPSMQRNAAEIWTQAKYPTSGALGKTSRLPVHPKIRIGYFSAGFGSHATAVLMAELFERHDRSKFELTAFSLGPDTDDDMRRRVRAAFDAFIDVRGKSDRDVALLARSLEIDIAIDLDGFTEGERTNIFAMRAAPIQVNYLGYPGTMGADYIDYLIADQTLIPASHQPYYSEKIAYLPHSYQPNDRARRISDRVFTRAEVGLPPQGFVFCCFNNNYKITPEVFASWMRILGRVEGSVLWLLEDNEVAARNLKTAAAGAGIDAARLVFAPRMALPEHLARHRLADLFLDTLPCNAHTTASDALWAGLPVLTQIGETFAGRVAASLLNAVSLPELVTTTQDAYEALAIKLATDPGALDAIRHKLAEQRLSAPLFDTPLFARHIEAAYTMMHERYRADLPPDHFYVPR